MSVTPRPEVLSALAQFQVPLREQPILVIVDSSLGALAVEQMSKFDIPNLVVARDPVDTFSRPLEETPEQRTKRRSALATSKARLHRLIQSEPWAAVISMYQEFIFTHADLTMTPLPLNIHPSRPEIPGMSYDVGPLDDESPTAGMQGATLHYMTEGIDQGSIIQVLEHSVPDDADYGVVRKGNQHLCLSLLDWLCKQIAEAPDAADLDAELRANAATLERSWGRYISAQDRDDRLRQIHALNPNHPALRGNKKFEKRLVWDAAAAAARTTTASTT